jgi:hypothetical protein
VVSIKIKENGTINAQEDLSNLRLYYEITGSCHYDGNENLFGTAATWSASDEATVTGTLEVGPTNPVCVYPVVDISSTTNSGETVGFQVTNPAADIVLAAGDMSTTTTITMGGLTEALVPGITASSGASSITSEAGATSSLFVALSAPPIGNVEIAVQSSDLTEGTTSTTTLTFTAAGWRTPQTVVVTGVDDSEADGDTAFLISLTASSSHQLFQGLTASLSVTNTDDDVAPAPAPTPDPAAAGSGGVLFTIPSARGFIVKESSGRYLIGSRGVKIVLDGGPNARSVALSNYPDFRERIILPYATSVDWTLPPKTGTKHVYAQFNPKWINPSPKLSSPAIHYLADPGRDPKRTDLLEAIRYLRSLVAELAKK